MIEDMQFVKNFHLFIHDVDDQNPDNKHAIPNFDIQFYSSIWLETIEHVTLTLQRDINV